MHPRLDVGDRQVRFADVTSSTVDAVLWTIGYRDKTSWVRLPEVVDAHGSFREECGLSPVPRLCYVGRSWQNNRALALLCGVGRDAAAIVDRVRYDLNTTPWHEPAPPLPAAEDHTSGAHRAER